MSSNKTVLSQQEKNWILEQRVTRLTDNKEVQIYPMGAERYLFSELLKSPNKQYSIRSDIEGKDVLVIPGYGNSCFLFAEAGAKSVTVYDKDPVTIAWIKAFKKYYYYKNPTGVTPSPSIEKLLAALTCWYPPLLPLSHGKLKNFLCWVFHPNSLRRIYIRYLLLLVKQALQSNASGYFEFDKNIKFSTGTIEELSINRQDKRAFDTAYVPYLLGVSNGIEKERDIVRFIEQLILLVPHGHILVTPSNKTKEFYFTGKSYFVTTPYADISTIPGLSPYVIGSDKDWYRMQGLTVFGNS